MNLKPIFMSMFAIAALASCNNEDEIPGGIQNETAKSWIGVKVALPAGVTTRAADGDVNAEGLETEIKTISLYYKKTDGTVGEITTTFDVAKDFTKDQSTGLYTARKAAEVPVAKGTLLDIYAAVNTPASNPLRPNWFNFRGTGGNPEVNYWTANSSELIATATGFTMTGATQGTTYEKDTEALAAHAKVELVRAVAKVLVTSSEHGIDPGEDFEENNSNGSSGMFKKNSLKWTIGNNNKKLFLLADAATNNETRKDPNWKALVAGVTDTDAKLNDEYENRAPSTYSMAVPKFGTPSATGYKDATSYVQYCNENTNEVYQFGNTSFISVQAEFVPNLIVETVKKDAENKIIMEAVKNTASTAKTFYYYSTELKYLTATAYDEATNAGVDKAAFKGPYTDGKCYYFVPIKDKDGKIGVLRNSYYTMRINSLKAPGDPTPTPEEPVTPVVTKSYISVDFEVAKWDPQSMGDLDLE